MSALIRTVVHFDDSLEFGGTEQALLHLMAGLDRRRWRPVLLHHPVPGVAPLIEGASRQGCETRAVPPMRTRRDAPSGLPALVRVLRAERPAVFHAHLTSALGCKYAILAASFCRIPVIVGTLQLLLDLVPGYRYAASQHLVSACIHRYIAVSDAIARWMHERFHVPARKLCVVPNAVPIPTSPRPTDLRLRYALAGSTSRPIVLTAARLDIQKGLLYLLEAAVHVPQAQFVVAGEGPDRANLEARARALGVGERVVFLGFRHDVPDLLASCDLFVLPSLFEGLPLSVLEAMAAGKPVLASRVPGTDEVVLHGVTGLLVPPRDPLALADGIRVLLSSPELSARLAAAAAARLCREFSVERMVQRTSAVYDELLAGRRAPAHALTHTR
jgi:glycosyltransferase involved in cell wall biosynthesis